VVGPGDSTNPKNKLFHKFSLALFLFCWSACSGAAPEPSKPLPPATFATLKQRIPQLRELPFKRDVVLVDSITDKIDDDLSGKSLAHLAPVYKRIGLLPENTDYGKALVEYERLQRLFPYEPQSSSIVVSPQAARIVFNLTPNSPRRFDQIPAAMALALALQEQHFRWQERLNRIAMEDRRLAFQAVAYGDAVLLAQHYARGSEAQTWTSAWEAITKFSAAMEREAGGLPDFLREKLIFPYREGSQFVSWALTNRGWEGVNGLFAAPPLSSTQILHPEKYYNVKEYPRRIMPLGIMGRFPEGSIVDQTLGEFLIGRLLANQFARDQAARIASGWRGDYLSAYGATPQPTIVWYSSWRDEESAESFLRAFKRLLERRHRISFQPNVETQWQATLPSRYLSLLQRNGSTIAWFDGVTSDWVRQTNAEIWTDVEIEPESGEFPFDSARRSVQLSRKRR